MSDNRQGFGFLGMQCGSRCGFPASVKSLQWAWLYARLRRVYLAIKRDPGRFEYTDLAMTPVMANESHTHELFRTDAAQAYVSQEQRLEKVRHSARVVLGKR